MMRKVTDPAEKHRLLTTRSATNAFPNRWDLHPFDYDLCDFGDIAIPVRVHRHSLQIGFYLGQLSADRFRTICEELFRAYPEVGNIKVPSCRTDFEFADHHSHWHVELPESMEVFMQRLSANTRYNLKRFRKRLIRDFGDYQVRSMPAAEVDLALVERYLEWKGRSHGFAIGGEARDYLRDFGVTRVYALYLRSRVAAVAFVSEVDGGGDYFENFSFDPEYSRYSLGTVIYGHMIEDMIARKVKVLYLSGGEYEYKRLYNGVRTEVRSGYVFRNPGKFRAMMKFLKLLPLSEPARQRLKKLALKILVRL